MTLEEVRVRLEKLRDTRCDCVLSIRAATTCRRCEDIKFYESVEKEILGY